MFKITLTHIKILNIVISSCILISFILLLSIWLKEGDSDSLLSLLLFSLPLFITLILLGVFGIVTSKYLRKHQYFEVDIKRPSLVTVLILLSFVYLTHSMFINPKAIVIFLLPSLLLIIMVILWIIFGNVYFKTRNKQYAKFADTVTIKKEKAQNKIFTLFTKWWLYPILWFLCIIALMAISYSNSKEGTTFQEVFNTGTFLTFTVMLPLGLLFFGIPLLSDKLPEWSGAGIYYGLYVIAFSVLPFVKEKWKKILIIFLLLWLFLAFFGCAIGIGMLSSGSDW